MLSEKIQKELTELDGEIATLSARRELLITAHGGARTLEGNLAKAESTGKEDSAEHWQDELVELEQFSYPDSKKSSPKKAPAAKPEEIEVAGVFDS